ncbi:tyrosine-type recombinase/integrase [Novacetimonas sp. GS1]|uniref:tyrosine-type recombinase/integrase n=1 Tax=Novacetimonas sp. GS1 TaxID=3119990 RepID=UPI0038D068BF
MKYRFGGKEKLLSIGAYPEVSLSGACKARDSAKEELRAGRDPSLTKKQRRAEAACTKNHLRSVGEAWLKIKKPVWSEVHSQNVEYTLQRFIWPKLGNIPVTDISPPMVLEVIEGIGRTGSRDTAQRVRQRLSAIFIYGIACGLGHSDPAAVIKEALPPVQKGNFPAITDLETLRGLLRTIEDIPAHPVMLLAIRFLALTAVRPGEVRSMPWTELDGDTWLIPSARMKMRRPHLVALSRQAQETIDAVRTLTGRGPLVFPNARWAHKPMSDNAMSILLKRAGFAGIHVPHGFRSSFSSIMNEKYPQDRAIIDQMLAHVSQDKVEAVYNRAEHRDRKRQLAQDWADMLLDGFCRPADLLSHRRR